MKGRILLVEDEPGLIMTLSRRLEKEDYVVEVARDGDEGLRRALAEPYDVVLLDVMLPVMDGFDVCREFRKKDERTPVLMLTARGQTFDKVLGLKLGADDYLTKPFQMMELLARIQALQRRSAGHATPPSGESLFRFADVEVDFRRAEVRKAGRPVEMSVKEYQLLKHFVENRGKALTRDELLNEVWGYDALPNTRTVDVHVARLRQKLEPNPRFPLYITTLHNLGYRFEG